MDDYDMRMANEALDQRHWYTRPLATIADVSFYGHADELVRQFSDAGWQLERRDDGAWYARSGGGEWRQVVVQCLHMGRTAIIDAARLPWYQQALADQQAAGAAA